MSFYNNGIPSPYSNDDQVNSYTNKSWYLVDTNKAIDIYSRDPKMLVKLYPSEAHKMQQLKDIQALEAWLPQQTTMISRSVFIHISSKAIINYPIVSYYRD